MASSASATSAPETRSTVMKGVAFTKTWAGEKKVMLGKEVLETLDAELQALDWGKLAGLALPDVTDAFPINKKYVDEKARTELGISSVAIRGRIGANLAFIAATVMNAAAAYLKSLNRNRLMGDHVKASFSVAKELIGAYTWVGTEPPPRATPVKRAATGESAGKTPAKKAKTEEAVVEEETK